MGGASSNSKIAGMEVSKRLAQTIPMFEQASLSRVVSHQAVQPSDPTTPSQSATLILSRYHGMQQLMSQSGCKDGFCRFLCTQNFSHDLVANNVSILHSSLVFFVKSHIALCVLIYRSYILIRII
jgi:hypothetical protein